MQMHVSTVALVQLLAQQALLKLNYIPSKRGRYYNGPALFYFLGFILLPLLYFTS
jgi:hypothetical protein